MNSIIIRRAIEDDRFKISLVIANGFEKDFVLLSKDTDKIANALQNGICIDKFYVAVFQDKIIGVTACTDCDGRAIDVDKKAYRKYFGLVKGAIAAVVLKEELMKPLNYPKTTGFMECVAVDTNYRGKGIAGTMLNYIFENSKYSEYILDVTDTNTNAIHCYKKIRFKEFERIKEKYGKQKGFNAKIYMRYKK